jgi:hypothetical protein
MHPTLRPAMRAALLALLALGLTGCGPNYYNPNLVDQSQAKTRLAEDTTLCTNEANRNVPPTYGMERFETDPTIEAQATRWVANVAEDDANQDVFATCMKARGWVFKKK